MLFMLRRSDKMVPNFLGHPAIRRGLLVSSFVDNASKMISQKIDIYENWHGRSASAPNVTINFSQFSEIKVKTTLLKKNHSQ